MAKNHIQAGKTMTWTNSTGSAVTSGTAVLIGVMLAVALVDIANGASGEVATAEVWQLTKEPSLAISQGVAVYWDNTNKRITTTASGNTLCGKCFAAALAADTTVKVKINT